MFNLSAVPEIGLGSKTICDICMRKQSSEYFNCGIHKMCDVCGQRFQSLDSCPLCGRSNQRSIEKFAGRFPSVIPSTYNPNEVCTNVPDVLFMEEEDCMQKSGSDNSLINSLSSSEMMFSDNENEMNHPLASEDCDDCDDFFASLDAKSCSTDLPCCGLMRSGLSLYRPTLYADSLNPEQDRICDFAISSRQVQPLSAAFVSCDLTHDVERPASVDDNGCKRRTLQKAKCLSGSEFQRMIEMCKDM